LELKPGKIKQLNQEREFFQKAANALAKLTNEISNFAQINPAFIDKSAD